MKVKDIKKITKKYPDILSDNAEEVFKNVLIKIEKTEEELANIRIKAIELEEELKNLKEYKQHYEPLFNIEYIEREIIEKGDKDAGKYLLINNKDDARNI